MVPRQSFWLVVLLAPVLLLLGAQRVTAAGLRQAATGTPTPAVTTTPMPGYETAVTLDSGNELVIERRWTFGELGIVLAVVANSALFGLHWIYEVTRREAR